MRTVRRMTALLTACLLALLATGCGTQASSSPEGTWTGPEDTQLELTDDGSVTGSDGCNHIGGSWEQDGDTIIFSDMLTTLMACMDVDVWLEDPRTATIEGDTMVVYGPDDVELGELHRA